MVSKFHINLDIFGFENYNAILLYKEQRIIQISCQMFGRTDLINMFYFVPLQFYTD